MRQLMFSAMRELGRLQHRRLVPQHQAGDDDGEHAGRVDLLAPAGTRRTGAANDSVVSSTGSSMRLRIVGQHERGGQPDEQRRRRPRGRSPSRRATALTDAVIAAIAVLSATSAVASLTRLSPSRIDTMRRGMPTRRATVVAATASGGATTAPSAKPAASVDAGDHPPRRPARRRPSRTRRARPTAA